MNYSISTAKMNLKFQKLYSLEVLRFIAAFCIFFGHYTHFYQFYSIPEDAGVFQSINPSNWGGLAVPIFFMMSGVIFTRNYQNKIQLGEISFFEFARRRFARLYPLHFISLVLCAVLQMIVFSILKEYFIYEYNDIKHFFLNLFFISHWGFQSGNSFNAPVWSVSHEIFLYLIFFIVCFLGKFLKFFICVSLIIFLIIPLLFSITDVQLLKSAFAYFLGSFIYLVYHFLIMQNYKKIFCYGLIFLFGISLVLLSKKLERYGIPHGAIGPILVLIAITFDNYLMIKKNSRIARSAELLGGLSYSSYLLHFPIQLFLVIFNAIFITIDFSHLQSLVAYVLIVLVLSLISFHYLEKPIQNNILNYGSST
jgi:peptidoglycan/LPS O-acetylase OafA/YrhL